MPTLVSRFVDLREGERMPALRAFGMLFGILAGHTILETARDALFLSKLPPSRLTVVYVFVAASALAATWINGLFVRRFGQRNALAFTLVAAALGTVGLYFAPRTGTALFVLYTWSALVGTLLGLQFWMLAGQRFTVAQGKRLFGPIASGGILGAMVGAGAGAVTLSYLPVEALLLMSSALFALTAVFVASMHGARRRHRAKAPIEEAPASTPASTVELFRRYPYLVRMLAVTVLSTAALLVTDYLFKSVASERVAPAALGVFFARTYAVLNAVALAVQLLLAGRVLRRLGVVPALVVLPLLITVASFGLVMTGSSLVMALAMKGADGALRYSLHRVGTELLWMPLPSDVRARAKALLDSVVNRLVQAAMGGILLLMAAFALGSTRVLAALACTLALGWLATSGSLEKPYLHLFRTAFSRGTLDVDALPDVLDVSSLEIVMDALSSRDARRVVAAIDLLDEDHHARLVPGLVLYHESEVVLLRGLRLATQRARRDWGPLVERLLTHEAEAVRTAAALALASFEDVAAPPPVLDDARAIPALIARLDHRDGREDARAALVARGDAALDAITKALNDPATPGRLRSQLPLTLVGFGTQRAADLLMGLAAKDISGVVRYRALRGLGRLSAGGAVVVDGAALAAELGRNLVEHLRLLSVEDVLEEPRAAGKPEGAEASATLVLGLLADKRRQSLERVFRLLHVSYPREDIRGAYVALSSSDRGESTRAMNFLDALTATHAHGERGAEGTRRLLALVIDDLPTADRIARAGALIPPPPSGYDEAIVSLLHHHDDVLALFAAYHALDLGTVALDAEVALLCAERPYLPLATPVTEARARGVQ